MSRNDVNADHLLVGHRDTTYGARNTRRELRPRSGPAASQSLAELGSKEPPQTQGEIGGGSDPTPADLIPRVANLCDKFAPRLVLAAHGPRGQGPRPLVPVPSHTGYDDRKSVADFLVELACATRWRRNVVPFLTWEDFR
ncbi:hypothetical protein HPB47_023507 [Ixodes persulcatus]|uniref:Uncharacterized protein n=1 Tax=Ixodes persulcatus TaxID=34615 RepID=A0AC60Q6T0_IXOPE|nr:hypothetical protein HPB47_023507 [Ixodes persulcatus]